MNLRIVRKKIKSVKNVRKITKAMQLISAVKMKKSVQTEVEGRPYRETLTEIMQKVSGSLDSSISPLLSRPNEKATKDLVIFISANKGLCGSFHTNILKFAVAHIDFSTCDFITVGQRGAQHLLRFDRDIVANYSSGTLESKASAIYELALSHFLLGDYRSVKLLYTQYISTTRSEVQFREILPVVSLKNEKKEGQAEREYVVEPSPQVLIDALLKDSVIEAIRGAIISSEAVEHSMRMMAMKTATDNASDVIYSLNLVSNKIRQSKITNELLDMVTAKESVG